MFNLGTFCGWNDTSQVRILFFRYLFEKYQSYVHNQLIFNCVQVWVTSDRSVLNLDLKFHFHLHNLYAKITCYRVLYYYYLLNTSQKIIFYVYDSMGVENLQNCKISRSNRLIYIMVQSVSEISFYGARGWTANVSLTSFFTYTCSRNFKQSKL